MNVTVRFNILITLAAIARVFVASPFLPDDETTILFVEALFPNSVLTQLFIVVIAGVLSTIILVYMVRALWNRLFTKLCGWKSISLAESYALSVFFSMFIISAV